MTCNGKFNLFLSIKYKALPIKIFVLNNDGYHSIRQTQKNFFPDNLVGTSDMDGVGFPDFVKIGNAFNIKSFEINNLKELDQAFSGEFFLNDVPVIYVINIDKEQDFEPKLKSRVEKDGKICTPELHDMWPFLSTDEIKKNLIVKNAI